MDKMDHLMAEGQPYSTWNFQYLIKAIFVLVKIGNNTSKILGKNLDYIFAKFNAKSFCI